ncbi:hypothetical protein EON62_05930, partial [archaeon]
MQCFTTVGAGTGLTWSLVVDGQRSVAPFTAYGPPVVNNFYGAGAQDASTDGGQEVFINGSYFSVDQFLGAVTYGPTGREFMARNCSLSTNHTVIRCLTRPGVGRGLSWLVTVGEQVSAAASVTTSYAVPNITSVLPTNFTTRGGVDLVITGTNFALNYEAVSIVMKMDNLMLSAPSEEDITAHWASLYAGGTGLPTVATWIDSLTTVPTMLPRVVAPGVHQVRATVPEGFGPAPRMFLLVSGVPSNVVTLRYTPPVINFAAPDRQGVPSGYLRVILEGSSFCNGQSGCGRLLVNEQQMPTSEWSHTRIVFT